MPNNEIKEISYERKKLGLVLGLGGTVIGVFLVLFFLAYLFSCSEACETSKYIYEIATGINIVILSQYILLKR